MNLIKKIVLLLAYHGALADDTSTPPLPVPTSPGNTGVFAEENVKAFSEYSIGLFYDDCEKWAGSFAWNQSAKLCDGFVKDCIFNYNDAVASCVRDTKGNGPRVNHVNNTVLPRFFVEDNIPYPQYTEIAIKGKMTMCQILEGFGEGFVPICYDFVQLMNFIENTSKEPYGLEVVLWDGFYSIYIGSCPGYPTVDCDSNETTSMEPMTGVDDATADDTSGVEEVGSSVGRNIAAWTTTVMLGTFLVAYR